MAEKHLLFSLDDENAKALGETIANKTSRAIVAYLTEEEASENKIAKALEIPINTVEYNLKKLLKAGLIEKSKKFFWSEKGKKIDVYKVANKIIIISPKKSSLSRLKSFLPVFLVAIAFTAFTWLYNKTSVFVDSAKQVTQETVLAARDATPTFASTGASEAANITINIGSTLGSLEYFLIAMWAIIVIFFIYSLVKGGSN